MTNTDGEYQPESLKKNLSKKRSTAYGAKVVRRYCQKPRYKKEQYRGRRDTLFRKALELDKKAGGRSLVITKRKSRCHWWSSLTKEEEELLSLHRFLTETYPLPQAITFDRSGKRGTDLAETDSEQDDGDSQALNLAKKQAPRPSLLQCLAAKPIFCPLIHSPILTRDSG